MTTGLEHTVIPALESVRLDTIPRKCREYMQAYREGKVVWRQLSRNTSHIDMCLDILSESLLLYTSSNFENLICTFTQSFSSNPFFLF